MPPTKVVFQGSAGNFALYHKIAILVLLAANHILDDDYVEKGLQRERRVKAQKEKEKERDREDQERRERFEKAAEIPRWVEETDGRTTWREWCGPPPHPHRNHQPNAYGQENTQKAQNFRQDRSARPCTPNSHTEWQPHYPTKLPRQSQPPASAPAPRQPGPGRLHHPQLPSAISYHPPPIQIKNDYHHYHDTPQRPTAGQLRCAWTHIRPVRVVNAAHHTPVEKMEAKDHGRRGEKFRGLGKSGAGKTVSWANKVKIWEYPREEGDWGEVKRKLVGKGAKGD